MFCQRVEISRRPAGLGKQGNQVEKRDHGTEEEATCSMANRLRGRAVSTLGEMEQEALVGHGSSLLLKERYDSDKVVIHICSKCGAIAIDDQIHSKISCPMCSSNQIEPVEVSYAFKLLMEELQGLHLLTKFDLKNKYE